MPRYLISIILIVIIVLVGIFLLWPNYLKYQNLQKQLEVKREEFKNKEKYYQELFQISERLKEYPEEISKIDKALPSSPSLPSFYNFLQKASFENGLILKKIGDFSTKQSTKKPEIKGTTIPIEVFGPYSAFKNFLFALEKSSRIIEVDNISFSTPKEGEVFNFELNIRIYSY